MWGTPPGGPPRGPHSPPRGPRVSQSSGKNCKNSQKLYKNCSCIKMPQFITLTSILGHLGSWWGPWGVKIEILQWPGVILEIGHRSFSIFALFLYVEHHCDTGILNFWLWSFIVPPYQCMFQTDVLSHHLASCSWVAFHSRWEFIMCLTKSLLKQLMQ